MTLPPPSSVITPLRASVDDPSSLGMGGVGPYAQPNDLPSGGAVAGGSRQPAAMPYIPALWRTRPSEVLLALRGTESGTEGGTERADDRAPSSDVELPWIDAFLDATSPSTELSPPIAERAADPMAEFIADEGGQVIAEGYDTANNLPYSLSNISVVTDGAVTDVEEEAVVDERIGEGHAGMDMPDVESTRTATIETEAIDGPAASVEEWPLAEASEVMRALADGLRAIAPHFPPATREPQAPTDAAALTTWAEDDLLDIMPQTSVRGGLDSGQHWTSQARRAARADGNTEATALVFEALAKRVRDGELLVPGFTTDMGDAAVLAATLAALLGVRH